MRKEPWDRQGANIASRWKEMYGEKLFRRPKNDFGEKSTLFRRCFTKNGFEQYCYMENISFHLNNREYVLKSYR